METFFTVLCFMSALSALFCWFTRRTVAAVFWWVLGAVSFVLAVV